MKTIFIGTSEFGIPALEMLKQDFDLLAVVTMPDRPAGRKKILTPSPVKEWAIKNNVRIFQPEKISEIAKDLKTLAPDFLIVASYGQIIPNEILLTAPKDAINLHSSLLPKYRGASPIHAAILNDDKETGVTIMLMDEKMDHGPILSQAKIAISESDDYLSLHQKLANLAAETLKETLPKWLGGSIQAIPQNHEQATFVKLISRADARIDWTKPARQIIQQIKAYNPEPGTWTTLDKKSVKIIKTEEVRTGKIELPGKIYSEGRDCLVKCGDYSIKLLTVQPEGKKPISGSDFLNGLKNLETKVFV